jgi:hypothetical protein
VDPCHKSRLRVQRIGRIDPPAHWQTRQ